MFRIITMHKIYKTSLTYFICKLNLYVNFIYKLSQFLGNKIYLGNAYKIFNRSTLSERKILFKKLNDKYKFILFHISV